MSLNSNLQPNANTRDAHFKALYSTAPDFQRLARCDADFAVLVKGHGLDFSDPASVVQLSKTLLKLDFGLELHVPPDRLCPPIPNRHCYILWLKDLLDSSSYHPPGDLVGLDVGTGASCIYPLLGCVQRPWSFIATDIDVESLKWARRNVQRNKLSHRISIVDRDADDNLVPLDELGLDAIDFVMTNPPFYASEEDLLESARRKARPPWTACTGSRTEMVVEGGEVAFVGRMVDESLLLRQRVKWYTSMLGFRSSVASLITVLREHGISNYAVTEFAQGTKTRRWAVAWSFGPMRPAQAVARGIKAPDVMLPPATESEVCEELDTRLAGEFTQRLRSAVDALELMSWSWDETRKRTGRERDEREAVCVLGFGIEVRLGLRMVSVRCRWLEGVDAVAFESFQGFLQAAARSAFSDLKAGTQ
ncbi:putative methyltransferase-like protein C27D7.08c [Ophiocordyceps camponoti-floridani]|uniref:U6 small nuclear RNA (adenine-(43)-N(6))-methyltransferase n=1 Tax=Ophiocordyceps camponoti-floridani TaxID=2030778 RepID=A0A8H4VBX8_9HYPO|nr:putative methyltransferase-like protein C27D7.08c [Ophiocordyceps camponoti-floridani]